MGKILYIRLDSTPLPEISDKIIVKDFNLESYFCTLLGKKLLAEQNIIQSLSFPGKIISDFKDSSPKIYNTVIEQWESMLVQLLVADDIQNQCFEINIPFPYFDWLFHHENPIYRKIGKKQSLCLSFKGELLYEELVTCILMKRLRFALSKITDDIDYIVVSLPILYKGTTFIKYLMQLNDKFDGLNIIDRQMFISKKIAEKRKALETMYELSLPREGRIRIRDKKTKKYGFINEQMELVVPCEYDFCGHFVDDLAFTYDNKVAFQIDQAGNIHELPSYDYYEVSNFSDGLALVRKDKEGNYAYINKEGKEIINVFYPKGCSSFREGLAMVVNADRKIGFIDKTGIEVIPCQFDNITRFSEGLASVNINDKYGFINKTGEMVIPCRYDITSDFSEGLAKVIINNKYGGFIDKTGEIVISYSCSDISDVPEGLTLVPSGYIHWSSLKKYNGLLLRHGIVGSVDEGLALVKANNKYDGFITMGWETLIPCSKYDYIGDFSEGLAFVKLNDKYGVINKIGKTVIPYKYDAVGNFSEGLAFVEINNKYGFIDKTGKTVIPCKYISFWRYGFSDGLALVSEREFGPHYFINKKGAIIVPPNKYRDMRPFCDGLACVDEGYIDNEGNEIIPPSILYSQSRDFSEGMVWITTFVKGKMRYALIKKEWIM